MDNHELSDKSFLEQEAEELFDDEQILSDEANDVPPYVVEYEDQIPLYIISPSSAVSDPSMFEVATARLNDYGFDVVLDQDAKAKVTRFAGTDEQRAEAFSRAAKSDAEIVIASRGGYGLSRILHLIDWDLLAKHPKRYVGYSDFTAFNLALLAQTGMSSYTGPATIPDFGVTEVDELTVELFVESMRDELEILCFEAIGSDEVDVRGTLWGGNLAMICSLIGTPYMPKVDGGILFIEDVAEHPYRIERMLWQLWQAGILANQRAIVLGHFTDYELVEHDNGFNLDSVIEWLRTVVGIPVVRGLPYGHGEVRATLPIGEEVGLATQNDIAYLVIKEHDHDHEDHDHAHEHD